MSKGGHRYLRRAILEVVENQLRDGTPPETGATLKHLMGIGHSRKDAVRLIGRVVAAEIFHVAKEERPFDEGRYVSALRRLPELPDESAGR